MSQLSFPLSVFRGNDQTVSFQFRTLANTAFALTGETIQFSVYSRGLSRPVYSVALPVTVVSEYSEATLSMSATVSDRLAAYSHLSYRVDRISDGDTVTYITGEFEVVSHPRGRCSEDTFNIILDSAGSVSQMLVMVAGSWRQVPIYC